MGGFGSHGGLHVNGGLKLKRSNESGGSLSQAKLRIYVNATRIQSE